MSSVHRTFSKRLRDPSHLWGRLVVLLAPIALLGVGLKLARIGQFFPAAGAGEVVAKVASDVAFGGAWALLWLLASWLTRGTARAVVFYLAHVLTLVLGVFTVISHEYVKRTGQPLTLTQITYAWRQQGELNALLESQLTTSAILLIVFVVLSVSLFPPLLGPLVCRLIRRRPTAKLKFGGSVAMVGLLIASVWSAPTVSAAFALAAPVQLAVAPVREAMAYPESLADDLPLATPETTTLVPRDAEPRNLVLITLESQRATSTLPETRHPVTPFLDSFAEQSLRPERGYSLLPHTSKSITAVTCGMAPPLDDENTEADPGSLPGVCLPDLLADQGYATAFFQTATEHFERRRGTTANFGYQDFMGVDEMDKTGFSKANYFGYEDDIMLGPQREWLLRNGQGPFMLGMLTVSGHHDYKLPGVTPIDFVDDPMLNEYLNGLHYQDQFVSHVIDMFKELGLYENTVFVVTGDHGEGFGEHRVFQHDNTIYEEGIRIPYLIHDPQRAGQLVEGAANQLAVLPTAVDLLGFDLVSDLPYRPSLASGTAQGPIVATCWARGRCTATLSGDMKVIHHFGDRRDEVYDVALDPHETNDLAASTDQAWIDEQVDIALKWYAETEQLYDEFHASR